MHSVNKRVKEEFKLEGYRNYNKLLSDIKNQFGTEDVQIKKEEYKKGFIFKKRYYNAIVRILEDDVQEESEQDKLVALLMDELHEIKKELLISKQKNNDTVLKEMREDMKNLASTIDTMQSKNNYPLEVKNLEKFLKGQNVEEDTINKIMKGIIYDCSSEELKDSRTVSRVARKQVRQLFSNTCGLSLNSPKQQIIMLVGPTGVGKTTTITKLSTYFKQIKKKDVGLITLDTYREGAISQLKDLCDYTNIEVEVASSKSEFELCLKKFALKDFIFIDTAGRSPYDLSEIRKLFMTTSNGNISEVCLVMSACTKYKDMLDIFNSYKDLNVNKLIFSKLDETKEYGNLLSFVDTVNNIPISYLTTGQEVPNDIEKARESKLTELIFKSEDGFNSL